MANNVELFELAKSIIANPAKWHKGSYCSDVDWYHRFHYARDIPAPKSAADIPADKCFCGIGALVTACEINGHGDQVPYREFVHSSGVADDGSGKVPYISDFAGFNDDPETTHADVMAAFDKAIEAAKAKAEA